MPSRTYELLLEAMRGRMQVVCMYQGHRREVCSIILGHTDGAEKVLTFQFAGGSRSGLPPAGEWRCLSIAEVTDVVVRAGPWRAGTSHRADQKCVKIVDYDVNPGSPFNPRFKL